MRRLPGLVLLAALAAGVGYFIYQNQQTDARNRPGSDAQTNVSVDTPGLTGRDTIRVGSFNIQVFGTAKAGKPWVMEILANIIRDYDVVAIQEIRTKDDTMLPHFVEQINAAGRHYDYVIGPRLGKTVSKEQYAFIFDTDTIEVDRSKCYTVSDPDELLQRTPLVGMFRCRAPPQDKAFTFRLIDIHTQPDNVKKELRVLRDVYNAVRKNDPAEDDVILLGDLNASEKELGELGQISGMNWAIANITTNTRGTKTYDNMLFTLPETAEYTGRSGTVDVLRRFNLTMEQAIQVSDHFPIWAEFSVFEGGNRSRVARVPEPSRN